MKIVTSGSGYIDIDAYAGCIAYAELLNLNGTEAKAVSTAPLNESVPNSLRQLEVGLDDYTPTDRDEFILVDVSKAEAFDKFVDIKRVVEIIDHHPAYEDFWRAKIGEKADIEYIGAACTQVFERWQASGKLHQIKPETARLLAAGILDNTLNLKALITTDRDKWAYKSLAKASSLSDDFAANYFLECQQAIETNLEQALNNDVKLVAEFPRLPRVLAQLTVWSAEPFSGRIGEISHVLSSIAEDWVLNLISLSDGQSYFLTTSNSGVAKMSELLELDFNNGVAKADRLWLRKELLKLVIKPSK